MRGFLILLLFSFLSATAQQNTDAECRKLNDRAMDIYNASPDEAAKLLNKAELLANDSDDNNLKALTQNNLAILVRMKGQFLESKKMSLKALKLASKGAKVTASIYNNIGACDRSLGKYKESIISYLKALKIYESQKQVRDQAIVTNNIGMVFSSMEQLDKAKTYHRKALQLSTSLNDKKGISEAVNNLAIALATQDSLDQAMNYFRKSLLIEESLKDQKGISESLNNVGTIHYYKADIDSALYYFEKSATIDLKMNNLSGAADGYNNIALVYLENKKYDKAKEFIDRGYLYANKAKTVSTILNLLDTYKNYYEATGNLAEANKKIKQFYTLKDSIQKVSNVKDLNELETKYQTAKKEKIILEKETENKRKTAWLVFVSLLSIFIASLGFLIYKQQKLRNKQQAQEFQLKSAISKIETQNKLQEQRLQISRDLHDNIGSQLTFIISSVDNIKYAFEIQNSKLDNKLSSISNFAKSTIIELRDTIWAMNNSEITFEDLQVRIHNFVEKAKEAKQDIEFKFTIEDELMGAKFTSIEGMNIYRTIQEAVNNSIKYAEAKHISIDIKHQKKDIIMVISDDGKGFDDNQIELGNGINNMKKRIADCNATIKFKTKPDEGTEITIKFPDKIG
ncbi:tetratricopeptide repeat-containing sensor histidine kinase [Flavobacterium wongokense]|uniref:tetratricopeptide repeat-containing sensor histidine kinase n=1 Tax=Flavobacterium wongokense TaxID=2910674 RepID=UPI001F1B4E2B|nr:tetratricopeptide repeat protein [Flavobacterium sp. WG47]MCF6130863.1 tetratricopeptide repeat protein [Flavobacterium sp. WG47]